MLSPEGYKRKTYDELLGEIITRAKQLFGANINTSELSVFGILFRIMAWFLSLVWKDNEDVYHSATLNGATKNNLDRLLPRYGTTRRLATYAEGKITVVGSPFSFLNAGFLVATQNDVFFETTEDIIIDMTGEAVVNIRALESGKIGNVGPGLITEIVNSNADIDQIHSSIITSLGREAETDQEARERARISGEGMGKGTLPSLKAALLQNNNVRAAQVIENYEDNPDQFGTPSRAFQVFVLGGNDQEIGNTIFENKAGGIKPHGDVEVNVTDLAGYPHKVYFSRALEKKIFIKCMLKVNNAFPTDGTSRIKSALIRFIGGVDETGALYSGLNMGGTVIHSKLISAVYGVEGLEDVEIELSTDQVSYISGNVAVGIHEVAQTDVDSIEVIINV